MPPVLEASFLDTVREPETGRRTPCPYRALMAPPPPGGHSLPRAGGLFLVSLGKTLPPLSNPFILLKVVPPGPTFASGKGLGMPGKIPTARGRHETTLAPG